MRGLAALPVPSRGARAAGRRPHHRTNPTHEKIDGDYVTNTLDAIAPHRTGTTAPNI
jgi:hypothetical protein